MRILIGGFHQESNSFSPRLSSIASFTVLRGADILTQHPGNTNTISSDFISALQKEGAEIMPRLILPGAA